MVAVMPTSENKHVLVIGARGVLGELVVSAFQGAGWTVRPAARRPARDEVLVDLDQPATIAAAVSNEELVINTVPDPGLAVERMVLAQGGAAINISALPAAAGRALRAVAGDARGTVVMNAGIAPGVTNLVAADLLAAHPEADEVEMAFTIWTAAPHGRASAEFAHRGLTAIARHRTTVLPLPDPFGERRCLGFGEHDAGWLGGVAEGRVIRSYVCVAERAVHRSMLALNCTGAMAKLPRSAFGSKRPASSAAASGEPVAHWVAVLRDGRRLCARTIECEGDFVHAARSTVVFAEELPRTGGRRGCFDPEEIFTLKDLEPKLRAGGVRIVRRSPTGAPRLGDL
jgi:hypothetical protein